MCGIAGLIRRSARIDKETLVQMAAALKHRGPDDNGMWIEENIGLVHTRLSIQDLTTAGHQPMLSLSKRFIIVFNGEIYNYLELKKELMQQFACIFETHSDTEILINAIELWGIEKTLAKSVGMFTFAAWDKKEKLLYLARDRFGEKPLYYGKIGTDFVFSSELKPIQSIYKADLHIDRNVLATYMRYGYIPTPYSIYKDIKKLEPGTYLTIDGTMNICQTTYWSATTAVSLAKNNLLTLTFDEAANQLEARLKHTLSQQMLADAPLGAFLSGGIDSSTVVALMQSLSQKPIKTFSIGFNEKKYDESVFAKAVANHIGTDHTELIVTNKDAMSVIPNLAEIYDEPFADSSQIPTFLVSQLAKQHVTVAVSGDGGDEVFGGYNRYLLMNRAKKFFGNSIINKIVKHSPEFLFNLLRFLPQNKIADISNKFKKIRHISNLLCESFPSAYNGFCTQPHPINSLVLQAEEFDNINQKKYLKFLGVFSEVEWMMLIDTITYLADDILAKVDRAAMAVSLETRAPFLDHNIFEFAWSLPEEYKVKAGSGKLILKEVLNRYVPKKLIDRPKMGFGMPYTEWLRGGLAKWAQDLLNEETLHRQGYLNPTFINQCLHEHLTGKRDWQGLLWNALMFQQWLTRWE